MGHGVEGCQHGKVSYARDTARAFPSVVAGPAPTVSTPAAHAALTSFCPPYASDSSTATCFPRSAACRASACHCCCPAVSASRAKTNSRTSLTQSQRQHRAMQPQGEFAQQAPEHIHALAHRKVPS